MDDRDFLMWIHDRLRVKYGDDFYADYMHKLRAIAMTLEGRVTPNVATDCEEPRSD